MYKPRSGYAVTLALVLLIHFQNFETYRFEKKKCSARPCTPPWNVSLFFSHRVCTDVIVVRPEGLTKWSRRTRPEIDRKTHGFRRISFDVSSVYSIFSVYL